MNTSFNIIPTPRQRPFRRKTTLRAKAQAFILAHRGTLSLGAFGAFFIATMFMGQWFMARSMQATLTAALEKSAQIATTGPSVATQPLEVPPTPAKVKAKPKKEKPQPNLGSKSAAATKKSTAKAVTRSPEEYIQRYYQVAVKEMHAYGVPASITLAQGLLESQYGTSMLAVSANNHFGIKCFSKTCKAGHCINRGDDTHKDFFRKYPTVWDCYRDHSVKVTTGRYAKLKKYGHDYRRWAYGLKKCGYASDPKYATALINTIERYDLDRFDRM